MPISFTHLFVFIFDLIKKKKKKKLKNNRNIINKWIIMRKNRCIECTSWRHMIKGRETSKQADQHEWHRIKTYLQWLFDDQLAINIGSIVFIFYLWPSSRIKFEQARLIVFPIISLSLHPLSFVIQVHVFQWTLPCRNIFNNW